MTYKDFEYSRDGSGIRIDKYTGSAKSVNIPNYIDNLPVTTIGEQAFLGCKSLTSVVIPDSTSVGQYAFMRCKSLRITRTPNVTTKKTNLPKPPEQNNSGCLGVVVVIVIVVYFLFS